jgi:formylglycine-generating enzyme required for sulfatase activity
LEHGSFTHTLLEGLRRQGEANCATVERLDQYLCCQVPEINATYRKPSQNPYLKAEPPYKLYFILLEQAATLRDVQPLKYQASLAENRGNLNLAEQLWIRVLGVSRADLEAIEAIKRIARRQSQSLSILPPISEPVTQPIGKRSSTPAPTPETGLKPFEFEVVTVNAKGQEVKREQKQARYYTEDFGNGITLEMVAVPGGKYAMGTEDSEIERLCKKYGKDWFKSEKPQHEVTVQPFFMGKYPVTQAQWRAIASLPKIERELEPEPSNFKGDDRPVEQVSWYDAIEFCKRLSKATGRDYRLPSEAEWEYACRALSVNSEQSSVSSESSQNSAYPPFYFGETITGELANYNATYTYADEPKGKYRKQTTPVGQFPANAFGLYDMHGNVWEWCEDDWHDNYEGAPTDGRAWLSRNDNRSHSQMLRGGSWSYFPVTCRSADRRDDDPDYRDFNLGLRVVASSRT